VCLWILFAACVLTWTLSLVTREHSWVDRIWSIVPVVYVWVFAAAAGLRDARLDILAALVTLWGIRLTFNFARKGGYAPGGEDYRWTVLQGRMKPWQFAMFNLFFIVIYQNVLLLLIALPAWTAFLHQTPLTALDAVAAIIFLLLLAGETLADQLQWNFQLWKASETAAGRTPHPRFVQSGLFRYSRHPNFFFEQAQWWVVFFFGAIAAGSVLQWTALGAILLTLLFIGSTVFTESISLSRYPEYAEYQGRTSPIIPWFPGRREREASACERPLETSLRLPWPVPQGGQGSPCARQALSRG
jgi:steroid 5-alpha reductase family enzyme